MICGLYIASPILKYIALCEKQIKYFVILSFIFVFIPNTMMIFKQYKLIRYFFEIINKIDIKIIGGYSLYFLLGYYFFSTHTLKKKDYIFVYVFGIISLILTIFLNAITCILMKKPVTIIFNNLLPNILFYTIAVLCLFQYLCLNVQHSNKIVIISKIANYVLGIYLVHPLILDHLYMINMPDFFIHPIFSIPIISIIVFLGSLLLVFIINKIPIINKYII